MAHSVLTEAVVTNDSHTFANDSHTSGLSWPAIIAGAFATAALALALLALGTGIGLSAASPWSGAAESHSTIGWTAIIWLVLMELIASSVGGYLAGRLRTRWINVHTHEVYFRDTAHGFLVWAVGLVITAAFLTSAATAMTGGALQARAEMADTPGSAPSRADVGPNGYLIDTLLRSSTPGSPQDNASVRPEIGLILANGVRQGSLPPADKAYLSQVVVTKTGVSETDAEKRVDDAYVQAEEVADSARKAIAHSMYWTFLALLIGAFCASFAATIGGRQRDHMSI